MKPAKSTITVLGVTGRHHWCQEKRRRSSNPRGKELGDKRQRGGGERRGKAGDRHSTILMKSPTAGDPVGRGLVWSRRADRHTVRGGQVSGG